MIRMLLIATCAWTIAANSALAQYSRPAAPAPDKTAAGGPGPFEEPATTKPTTPDSAFVAAAAQSAFYGNAMGRLAETRASSPEVTRLAQEIATIAARMSEELKPQMKTQRVAAPAQLDQRQKAVHDWLQKLSGPEFDRAFISNMRATRASDVMVFQRAADKAHDADLRAWAATILPTLKGQQDRVNGLK
jgi:putative membrane protein